MFQIYGAAAIFCFLVMEKLKLARKRSILTDEIKKQLLESITINNAVEIDEINKWADKVEKLKDAPNIIKDYEKILRTKKKGIIAVAFHQRKVFKRFKEKFMQMVGNLKIHKNTIIFKINLFKLIEKHSKLMKYSVTLMFLKNYFKYIKQICKENSSKFE